MDERQTVFFTMLCANGDVVTDPYFPFEIGNILEGDFEETLPLKLAEV